jgi:hypothetical protein
VTVPSGYALSVVERFTIDAGASRGVHPDGPWVDWEVDACRIRVDFPNHRYALSYDALENPDDGGKSMVDSLPEGFVELRHDADVEDDGTLSAS